jgi:hypothetical protein
MYLERSGDRIKSNPNLKLVISLGEKLLKGHDLLEMEYFVTNSLFSFL